MIRLPSIRLASVLVTSLLVLPCARSQSSNRNHIYTDPGSGVRFAYTQEWQPATGAVNYLGALILSGATDVKPTQQLVWHPLHGALAGTEFGSLSFVYLRHAEPSEDACSVFAAASGAAGPQPARVIHGVRYTHFAGDDAAMMHQLHAEIFATYRAGNCLLFEEDLFTSGFGAKDGIRQLTAPERTALEHRLAEIFNSVSFVPPGARKTRQSE